MSYSFSRTKLIEKIKFGLLSPDEIRKMSAARIITADTYDEDGLPIPSGLMDQRLGTIEPGQRCQTCGNLVSNCMGHFGHITCPSSYSCRICEESPKSVKKHLPRMFAFDANRRRNGNL